MIAFWILAPIMVIAALGILFVRKAVHAALLLAVVMICLAVLYVVLEAPFLFAVQIIVYTGAILMLFLFVLMLVGVDASDSVVETIRGQRVLAIARRPAARRGAGRRPRPDLARHRGRPRGGQRGRQHPGPGQHPLLALRLRVRGHQRAADHRGGRRDGARPPRAAHPEGDAAELARPAGQGLRRDGHAPRPAAVPGRLRPAQRGRHPGPAARRHRRAVVGVPGAHRPRHGPLGARARRRHRGDRDADRLVRRTPAATRAAPASTTEEAPATGGDAPSEHHCRTSSSPGSSSRSAASGCSPAATRSWCSCASS